MDRVIYAKYNSLRKPEYRIHTEIHEDEGRRYVAKKAGDQRAMPHLDTIMANREAVTRLYRDVRPLEARREGNRIIFPFVTGTPLIDKINTDKLNKEQFFRTVNGLFEQILAVKDECKCRFTACDEFTAVFGRRYMEGVPAISPANIDALFNNFIETEQGVYCLDYEWVYDFPVPVDYIKYRTLLYLHTPWANSFFDGISRDELMSWFGLGPEECEIYWRMEKRFQQSIHGANWKYRYLDQYNKTRRPLKALLDENEWQRQHIANIEQVIHYKEEVIQDKELAIQNKDVHITNLEHQIDEITHSFYWRMTNPFRRAGVRLKTRHKRVTLALGCIKTGLRHGPRQMKAKWTEGISRIRKEETPPGWATKDEIKRQRKTKLPKEPKISILVPLYNTPEPFLKEMIRSVKQQTYRRWELCLADGSDQEHPYVKRICKRKALGDKRIRYKKLASNKGISENTNECFTMATGEYIALFDHDDILHPCALYETVRAVNEKGADYIYTDEATFQSPELTRIITYHFKPDFAPDNLLANNYICHFSTFSRELMEKAGGFRQEYDGSQDHDLILRLTHIAKNVVHIPRLLYYWRSHPQSVAQDIGAKQYAVDAAKRAVRDFLHEYEQTDAEVISTKAFPTIFQIVYPIAKEEKVSIIIPNKDHVGELERCVESILKKTTYDNYEILIVENNSEEEETQDYYDELQKNGKIRIIRYTGGFNYSGINNFAVKQASGEYLLFLNNDTEVITGDWIRNMMMYAQRDNVGAVGAKLYFPDGTIQHAGVTLKLGAHRTAGHTHYGVDHENLGYMGRLCYAQDVSAVTAACMMMRRSVFEEINGFDEELAVALNDVDLCLKARKKGYLNIFTPFAELYHYESASRGQETAEKAERYQRECDLFKERWKEILEGGDPYYNPNFSLDSSTFDVKIVEAD